MNIINGTAIGKEIITANDAVKTLTVPEQGNVRSVFISVSGAGVRFWLDGSVPSATEGHLIPSAGDILLKEIKPANVKLYVPNGVTVSVTYIN